MSVRTEVEARLAAAEPERDVTRLPRSLRTERGAVRMLMLHRLAMQGARPAGELGCAPKPGESG